MISVSKTDYNQIEKYYYTINDFRYQQNIIEQIFVDFLLYLSCKKCIIELFFTFSQSLCENYFPAFTSHVRMKSIAIYSKKWKKSCFDTSRVVLVGRRRKKSLISIQNLGPKHQSNTRIIIIQPRSIIIQRRKLWTNLRKSANVVVPKPVRIYFQYFSYCSLFRANSSPNI